ncbi:hypothetical protein DQP55_02780 [Mycolicibacterium sp. GF69]|uniref:DsrE family protein n=1 Tax=Mycolicibacterium sp. GF69 TaxID=2267251 RepID=UPI000DCB9EC6|nr:DsrE family protein [Mycolicibacterium sp. GF69]RAV18386.1 hypothetical protein DQP55_02780 [Mycolicibacterium sp. GF69]
MKKLSKCLMLTGAMTIISLGGIASPAYAEPLSEEQISATENAIRADGKYALVVSDARHMNVAIMTGREFKAKSSAIDFQIVVYGKVVQDIATDPAVKDAARRAVIDDGLKVVACDISVQRMGIDPALLPPEVPTTQNALTYVLGLQEQGYETLTY